MGREKWDKGRCGTIRCDVLPCSTQAVMQVTLSTQNFSHTEAGCKSMGCRETGRKGKLFSSFPLGAVWPAGRTYLALLDASFSPFYPSHTLQQAVSSISRSRGRRVSA